MARLNKQNKAKLFQEIKDNCTVKFHLECTICGAEHESDGNFLADDSETELDEFQNSLHDYGWRIFHSKEYGQVGLTCPDCIQNEK